MTDYRKHFKDKKITLMGLGLLGRGIADAKFLAENGANLIVTDLKSTNELISSLKELEKYNQPKAGPPRAGNIKFVLGKHRLADFRGRDLILKAASVPLNSPYIAEARKNSIPIEMSASLLARSAPATIVGVTGTRGKSTVTELIYHILKLFYKNKPSKVWLGGNVRGAESLPLIKKVRAGDVVVLELDSWQLQGFGEKNRTVGQMPVSPQIAVFTNLMNDHLNYYHGSVAKYLNDKAQIFFHQKENDVLVVGEAIAKQIKKKYGAKIKSKVVVVNQSSVPKSWQVKLPGKHNLDNVACAIEAAKALKVPFSMIKQGVETFAGVAGRLEYLKTLKGVKIYNDNNATTPEATSVALEALGQRKKNIVLIIGGADKKLPLKGLWEKINKFCKAVVLLPGTGTDKLKTESLKLKATSICQTINLKQAVREAMGVAKRGDILLFSPAFASFGLFKNEYQRNDEFVNLIRLLK